MINVTNRRPGAFGCDALVIGQRHQHECGRVFVQVEATGRRFPHAAPYPVEPFDRPGCLSGLIVHRVLEELADLDLAGCSR
ncbi:MAG: hypothetical protein OXG35_04230 [Acidobacteria bacterium]|nr:hypothetical protein [Acidobacteriota bacterium]